MLVPQDPLRPRRPDEHFVPEAVAAREAGLAVAVVDHDALVRDNWREAADAAVVRVPAGRDAVYRGWMLRAEQYAAMADALARRGVTLRTSAANYRRAHELPGWYPALASVTPAEARTWWVNGVCRVIGAHPDTPDDQPPTGVDLSAVAPLVKDLGLPFVTVDLALRADGVWRVIELGDGRVSDRPATTSAEALITALNVDER